MLQSLSKLKRFLEKPVVHRRVIDELTAVILEELRRDRHFIRRLRECAFLAIQRKCDRSLWERLLTLAADRLNEEAVEAAQATNRPTPAPRTYLDWTQGELRGTLAKIDESLVSNAMALVTLETSDKVAPLSLPTLVAILVDLQCNWAHLGSLPPYRELRDACYQAAIGFAQRRFCERNKLRAPKTDQPSLDELRRLDMHFVPAFRPLRGVSQNGAPKDGTSKDAVSQNVAEQADMDETWRRWGVGWLLARSVLGLGMREGSPA